MVRLQSKTGTPTTNSLFEDKELVDAHFFILSDQKTVSAHKLILAGASKVFKAMFFGDLKEEGDKVKIVDASEVAFNEFLRFIYTNQIDLTFEIVAEVMNLAHKYEVDDCFDVCKSFLEDHLTDEDVFSGFELAVLFKINDLMETIGKKVGERANTVFNSDEFLDCSQDVLRSILEIKFLSCNPEDVFDASMKWAKVACEKMKLDPSKMKNLRQQLADCVYSIPFRQMRPATISDRVKKFDEIFDREELKELLEMVATPESLRLEKFKHTSTFPNGFNDNCGWMCIYHKVNEAQVHYLKKSEVTLLPKDKHRVLRVVQLLIIRHNQLSDVDKRGSLLNKSLIAILTVVEKSVNGSQCKVLLKQQISINVWPHGTKSSRQFPLKDWIVLEETKDYEIRIDFDSSWTENTFFAVVPYPDVNKWNGIISDYLRSTQ